MTNNKYFFMLIKNAFILTILIIGSANFACAGERLTVAVPTANIRSGPGTTYEIIWKVEKYHPLQIIKKKGAWYNFKDYEGDPGWIHKKLVDNSRCVITNKKNCNIRSGPGTKHNITFTSEKGVPFKIIKKKGNWINIQHSDGDKGWIHNSLVW